MKSIMSICVAVALLCLLQVALARYSCGCRKVGLCGGLSRAKYFAGNGCSIRNPNNGGCCVNCGGCCCCYPCCCCCPITNATSTYSADTTPVVSTVTGIDSAPIFSTEILDTTTPVLLGDITGDTSQVIESISDTPLVTVLGTPVEISTLQTCL